MLDLSINTTAFEKDFDRIAQQLLQGYILRVGKQAYQLTELEFYYNNTARTIDSFAHKHPKHYPSGTWRLHGAGLDIVLSEKGVYHGGILLRGLQALDEYMQPIDPYIDGPWNTAAHCVMSKGTVTATSAFHLEAVDNPFGVSWAKSPRVGLFLRKVEDLKYICRPWRYNSRPIQSQRYRQLIFLQGHLQGEDLQAELGLTTRSKNNYLQYFEEGRALAAADFVNGGTGVRHTCRLFGYCYQHDLTK